MPREVRQSAEVIVWTWNVEAFEVFRDCASQWRYITPFGANPVPTGIERSALASSMQMLGVEDTRDALQRIRHIEAGALEAMRS